jgi:hypothetical protein
LDIYWNILKMHGPINVKSPNNTSKWQMGFNSAFKGLKHPGSEAAYHMRLVLRVRMREAIPPVPHMPFWLA